MRLHYLYVERFMNLSRFEISFNNEATALHLYGDQLNLRFFVGPNGSGKSHVMEALGLIFTSLMYQINIDLSFALEYELKERTVRIISTVDLPPLIRTTWFRDQPPAVNTQRGFGVYLKEHGQDEWTYVDHPNPDLYRPSRVVAVASGPTSGFQWAMYERPLSYLLESVQGEWGEDVGLSLADQDGMQADARARWDAMLDRPQVLVMNPQDCRYAVLSTLLLGGTGPTAKVVNDLANESGIVPEVGSFSFVVSGDWRDRLQEPLRSRVRDLLRTATVRWVYPQPSTTANDTSALEGPPDFLAAYDVTASLVGQLEGELHLTSMGLFLLLIACRRRGVIKDVHLGLVPRDDGGDKVDGLMPEDGLSDGEYLRLGRYSLLWMLREEQDCLILLDEPETHFNDLWKIDLVSDIVRLLRPGYAEESGSHEVAIATHSAITLTDAESDQVYAFENGRRVPTVRTFGAGTDDITRGVYGAKPSQGRFAVSVIEEAIKTQNTNLLQKLKEIIAPGYYHFRVHEVLEELLQGGHHAPPDKRDR